MNNPNKHLNNSVIPVGDEQAEAERAKVEVYALQHPGSLVAMDHALEDDLARDNRIRLQGERAEEGDEE